MTKERNLELTKERDELSNKYLALYDENDRLQELMADMQYKVQNSEKDGDTNELSDLLKIGQKGNAEEEIKKIQRELQM